jgi:hypothetical protein
MSETLYKVIERMHYLSAVCFPACFGLSLAAEFRPLEAMMAELFTLSDQATIHH